MSKQVALAGYDGLLTDVVRVVEALANKVLAAEYRTTLPAEQTIAAALERTRELLETRAARRRKLSGKKRKGTSDGKD